MSETADWINTHIGVDIDFKDDIGPVNHRLVMPNNCNVTTSRGFNINEGFSDGEYNAGYTALPVRYSWTLTIPTNTASARLMRALLITKQDFSMSLRKQGETYELQDEGLGHCRVTNVSSGYTIGTLPALNVSGIALQYNFYNNAEATNAITNSVTTTTYDNNGEPVEKNVPFGSGESERDEEVIEKTLLWK